MVVYYSFLRRICRVSLEKDAVSLKCNSCKTRMTVVILNWQGWFKVIVWKCTARCIFVETKTPSVGGHQSTEQFYFRGHQITLGLPQISTMLSSSFVLFSTKVETQLQRYASYFLTMLISTFFPRESVHALSQVFPNQLIIYLDLPWQQVFVLLGWLFHTAPLSALKIHMCRWIAKGPVERKKNLGIRSGTTLSVCHCSSSRGQSEAPATAHNSFYLSAGICFARQWESVLAVAIFHNILSPIFQPQSNIYLLPRLLLTRQVSCGRRVPAVAVVANRGETLAESAANAQQAQTPQQLHCNKLTTEKERQSLVFEEDKKQKDAEAIQGEEELR